MKIILLENVVGLGRAGDIKTVKNGYARNFLIPQRVAEMATHKKENVINRMREALAKKAQAMIETSMELKDRLEELSFELTMKSGREGKLFGSVTNGDVVEMIAEKGFEIDKKKIVMDHVKTVGEYTIKVRLDEGVTAEIKLNVKTDAVAKEETKKKSKKEVSARKEISAEEAAEKAAVEDYFSGEEDDSTEK